MKLSLSKALVHATVVALLGLAPSIALAQCVNGPPGCPATGCAACRVGSCTPSTGSGSITASVLGPTTCSTDGTDCSSTNCASTDTVESFGRVTISGAAANTTYHVAICENIVR